MDAMLDHLPHAGHPRGPQQLAKLAEVVGFVIGKRRDQVGALAGAAASPLSVR
jgi:hypothetical protein